MNVLLTYVHDENIQDVPTEYPGKVHCPLASALAMRMVESHDFAYERPKLYCGKCQSELKLVVLNGSRL